MLAADVFSRAHPCADRFRIKLAGRDAGVVSAPGLRLEVQAGFGEAWTSLITGVADTVQADPLRGTLDIEGRDLAALLIEARAGELFLNRTASEIANEIATRHGLGAAVTSTTTPVGRYYQAEHGRLLLGRSQSGTEWDLLAKLAAQEGFELGMLGDRLLFGPRPDLTPAPVSVTDCVAVELEHQLGLSRGIELTVQSWGTHDAAAVVARRGQGAIRYRIVRPNLSDEQAQRMAERALADLMRHERTAGLTMPGELNLTAWSLVALQGAGAEWDRTYAVAALDRHLDVRRGFTQGVRLQGVPNG